MRKARLGEQSIEREVERLRTLLPGEWELLSVSEISIATAQITFSNLPTRFRELVWKLWIRSDRALEVDGVYLQCNADTGANYDYSRMGHSGAVFSSVVTRAATQILIGQMEAVNSRANCFSQQTVRASQTANTSAEKEFECPICGIYGDRSADADVRIYSIRGAWRSTAALSSVVFYSSGGSNFVAGTKIWLYGVY